MSRREGCAGCGSDEHNLRSCDTEDGARHYESLGRPEDAARVRRRAALVARREDVPLDQLLDHYALARRSA